MVAKQVSEFMSRAVHTVGPETKVLEAARDMHRLNIGAMVVMQDGAPSGLFTERDLLVRVVTEGADPQKVPVSAVMTSKVMTVSPEAPVEVAALLMHKRGFRHLLVVEDGKLLGILSLRDILEGLLP